MAQIEKLTLDQTMILHKELWMRMSDGIKNQSFLSRFLSINEMKMHVIVALALHVVIAHA